MLHICNIKEIIIRSKEITLRIPKNTLKQLNFLAKNTNRFKTDIVINAIQNAFLDQLDSNFCILDEEESETLYKKLESDIDPKIQQRRDSLIKMPYSWD